jgi:hypothetical protein
MAPDLKVHSRSDNHTAPASSTPIVNQQSRLNGLVELSVVMPIGCSGLVTLLGNIRAGVSPEVLATDHRHFVLRLTHDEA